VPNALIAVHHKSQRLGQEWLTLTLINRQKLWHFQNWRSVTDSDITSRKGGKAPLFPHKFLVVVWVGLSRAISYKIRLYWNIEVFAPATTASRQSASSCFTEMPSFQQLTD